MDMNKQFGVREIANVVLKAKAAMKIGNTDFDANEPVLYFDTLKTSTVEGAATTVYATGGRGNARLISWDGERTITFTMEDALISPMGLAILTGAGLISEKKEAHFNARVEGTVGDSNAVTVTWPTKNFKKPTFKDNSELKIYAEVVEEDGTTPEKLVVATASTDGITFTSAKQLTSGKKVTVHVDYYSEEQILNIDIEPGKFSGNFYLEAATLFRDTDGKDHAAEFIIPNCRVQSNFTFSMASSGDPSTFTFTMDAFPGYTAYDKTKKVLCAIQVLADTPASNS